MEFCKSWIFALALLAALAVGQTCPCSFAPAGSSNQVVLVETGSPNRCAIESRPSGGCYCVSGTGTAGICSIDTSAVAWTFIVSGSDGCTSFSSPVAICPGNQATATCEFDGSVPWTFTCELPQSQFPSTSVTLQSLTVTIKQEDNFTFGGYGTPGEPYSFSYETANSIEPSDYIESWPNTPTKTVTGNIPSDEVVIYTGGSDVAELTLAATFSGLANAQSMVSDGSGISLQFSTTTAEMNSGFIEAGVFSTFSRATITLTATYN